MKERQGNGIHPFAVKMQLNSLLRAGAQLCLSLEEAGIKARTEMILRKKNIYTMEELSLRSEEDLRSIPGMKPENMADIARALKTFGLALNPPLSDRSPEELAELYREIRGIREIAE